MQRVKSTRQRQSEPNYNSPKSDNQKSLQNKRQRFFQHIAAGFMLASAILAGVGAFSYRSMTELIKTSNQVTHSQEVINHLEDVLSQMKDAETGQRGYLLTGKESYLEPYHTALNNVNSEVSTLETLTADNTNHQNRLKTLKHLIANKLAELKQTIDLRQSKGVAVALQVVQTDRGNNLMSNIHKVIYEMELEENSRLTQRSHVAALSARYTMLTFSSGIFLTFFILCGVYYVIYQEITARKQAEAALSRAHNDLELRVGERTLELAVANQRLQEEEERYRSLMLASTQIIWTNSADGRMTGEQPSWAAFTGQTYEQYQNFGWSAALHPDDVEHTINQWNRAVSMRSLFEVEHRVRRSDGEYRCFSVRAAPVLNTDGSIREWVGAHTDITERQQAELELRQSEQRYRFLADAMPQIVWTALSNGYLDYYNRRWYEFTGFMEGAGGDDSWKPILHPDDVGLCLNRWSRSVHTGEAYEIECRFFDRRTGSYRWHLGRALPMRNQAGEIVLWAGTCTDIHDYKEAQKSLLEAQQSLELKVQERTAQLQAEIAERKQAEAALQASEAELRALFAAMTDVVIVRDAQGRCLRILPTKTTNLYKKSAAEMIGKTLHETFSRSEADTIIGYIRQALNTQKTVYGEYSLLIEEREVCFSTNFSPISLDSVMLVARDITERKQAESELLKAKGLAEAAKLYASKFNKWHYLCF